MNRLLRLLASNRKRGSFRAEAAADDDSVTLYLYDVIVDDELEAEWFGGVSPLSFAKEVAAISAATIHLRINSPGGSAFAAAAMQQALREHPARVVVHIDGVAASAATQVMLAGDEIIMAAGAMLMIHNAWTLALGDAVELTKTAALLQKVDGLMASAYAARTGRPTDEIAAMMAEETWFTPDEAVAIGLADSVADDTKAPASARAAAWDLSAFERAPAPAATKKPIHEPATPSHDGARLLRALDARVAHLTV